MNLLCLSDFNETGIVAKAGDVLPGAPSVANRLLDSWPGCWQLIILPNGERSFGPVEAEAIEAPDDPEAEAVLDSRLAEIETEAIEAPTKDKMIHAPARAKAHKRK